MAITKAVIPAAGLGTRFLPATKAQPKEMIPIVDRPAIQYAVEEAARARMTQILIISSRGKSSIEDHFDRSLELEQHLESSDKIDELREVQAIAELADVHYVRQKEPLGFGHAVALARSYVGDDPFAVLVPDEIVPEPRGDERALMDAMAEIFEAHGASVITAQRVPKEDVSAYGVIDAEVVADDVMRVLDMVEKPRVEDAPSDLAARGRYLLTPDVFEALERTTKGVGGEIQLTDALKILGAEQGLYAYVHEGPIFDVGKKLDYLKATIELALRRDDLAKPLKEWLVEMSARLD